MAEYELSSKAATDLEKIFEHTILNFGLRQARAYLLGLHKRFQELADNPNLGRSAEEFAPMLKRFNYRSHLVFYRASDKGILECTSKVSHD